MADSKKKSATKKSAAKKVSAKKFSTVESKLQDALAQVKKLTKKLARTQAKLDKASKSVATSVGTAAADVSVATKKVLDTAEAEIKTHVGTPSALWTLVELRAYAKNKGVVGYSSKNKAELLALLKS